MRIEVMLLALCLSACSAEVAPPAPVPRSLSSDIDGDGFEDSVRLSMDDAGWTLMLTFGGRPHDVRTIDRGPIASQARWQVTIEHGGNYRASAGEGATARPIRVADDAIVYSRHDRRRMLVWNSPDTGIELVAID